MFSRLITRATLKKFAGSRSFQRGEEYFADGAVERLRATDRKITANVDGTDTYWVELRNDDDELDYDCTCPYATGGNFCKHCVAVGLAWLAQHASEKKSIKSVSCRGSGGVPGARFGITSPVSPEKNCWNCCLMLRSGTTGSIRLWN